MNKWYKRPNLDLDDIHMLKVVINTKLIDKFDF